jgi:hypothetical protein
MASFEVEDVRFSYLFSSVTLDAYFTGARLSQAKRPSTPEAHPGSLERPHGAAPVDPDVWIRDYDSMRNHWSDSPTYSLPWSGGRDFGLWASYLEEEGPERLTGRRAFSLLMPFRHRPFGGHRPSSSIGRVAIEVFCYGHGCVVIVTVTVTKDVLLDELSQVGQRLREGKAFSLEHGKRRLALRVDELARLASGELVRGSARATDGLILPDSTPFVVATIVRTTGPVPKLAAGNRLHYALHTLAGGSENSFSDDVSKRTWVETGFSGDDIIFGRDRGRTVWWPGGTRAQVSMPAKRRPRLGDYHRQLVIASAQVESLLNMVGSIGGKLREGDGELLPYALRLAGRNASGAIGRVFGGSAWPDQSVGLRRHIEKWNRGLYRTDIDKVRDYFDMTPMHA